MRKLLMLLIQAYRYMISPLLPARCRFMPTCSEYAAEAIGRFGARKGGFLALKRVCRCHPWGSYGYDPVPDTCGAGKEEHNTHADRHSSPRQTVQ